MKFPSLSTSLLISAALSRLAFAEQVVVSEIMYNPPGALPEFIELSNITATPLDMALWRFSDGVDFTFPNFNAATPSAHLLLPNEKILISSASDAATRAAYPGIPGGVRIFGPWGITKALGNNGDRITVKDKNNVTVCAVNYGDSGKWAVSPDGAGHSLVLADADRAIDDWRVWRASTNRLGSAGVADPAVPAAGLVINEVHFSTVTGRVDWVELRNNSATTTISAATMILSAATDLSNPVALAGNVTPGAVVSFNVDFATDNGGNVRIHLADAASNVRDAVRLTRVAGRPSHQVFPAGGRQWFTDTTDTREAANNPARNVGIVINELMADPPSGQRDGEFIELYNRGVAEVNLGGWRLDDDVEFVIPANTMIAPGGYLVLAANSAFLNANYSGLAAIGNWDGSLSNNGSRVQLKDRFGNLADEVDYRFGGEWPELAAGDGSSLELINPDSNNAMGSSWRDSDESAKSTFTAFTINGGTYRRLTHGGVVDDEILMWLVGDGHIIMRNVEVRPTAGGANVLVNTNVTTATRNNVDGWLGRGNHWASYHDAEGVHIVADGGGDSKVNQVEKDSTGMVASTAYTLMFEARWVYGKARIVAQSWDMSWGGTALVPVPANLGTPGAQNSRYVAAAPPEITTLNHSPATPTTGSTVTVTAKVSSSSPIASVQLFHRLDNINYTGAYTPTTMADNGSGGDALAGDGIYSAQIPLASFGYNTAGAIVEFYVRATAANGQTVDLPRGSTSGEPYPTAQRKTGQWVVDNQTTSTELRRLRVVIPAYWLEALNTPEVPGQTPNGSGIPTTGGGSAIYGFKFPKHNSHYFPCTVVMNDNQVFYGASVHKTGSPFTRSVGNSLDRGRVALPGDRSYRGHGKIYWDNDAAGGSMLHNRANRYLLYLCGVPANENEVMKVTRNNTAYAVRESNEVFDKDMLNRIWDNGSSGYFYENDDAHVISDDGNVRLSSVETAWDYNPGNRPAPPNPVTYHNNFVPGSREVEYDFAPVVEWTNQIETNGATLTVEQMERMADIKAMAAYAAVRGYTADWDSLTLGRAKNGYFYNRPDDHKWMLIQWDSDGAFQTNHINDAFIGAETNVPNYYNRPSVRREVYYYMTKLMGEYALNSPRLAAWLAAEEAASPSFTVPATYATWPTTNASAAPIQTRVAVMQTFIGAALTAPFALVSTPASPTMNTVVAYTGTAPANVFRVECVGHPEGVFAWSGTSTTDTANWTFSNLRIRNGANTLTFRAFDENGVQLGVDLTHSITKTTNAPPFMAASVNPSSQNVALGETVVIDASASFDPDGTALTYTWTISPTAGFVTIASTPSSRTIQFTTPGNYTFTIRGFDGVANINITRDITAYSTSDFTSFGVGYLAPIFTARNVELLDNHSPDSWYSLNETSGSIALNLSDTTTRPLTNTAPIFPTIMRPVPATTNWILQTSITPENRAYGSFLSGLYLETVESGVITRYAFGYDGGLNWKVYKAIGAAAYAQIGSVGYVPTDTTLRIRRSANSLFFEYRINGVQWSSAGTSAMVAGSTTTLGGIFSATGTVGAAPSTPGVGIRTAFDYLLFADPGNTADLFNNLRITEIMYNPSGAGGVEFIELQNIGASAINLSGAYFDQGDPISNGAGDGPFTFGATTLQPGQYCIVTNNSAAFTGSNVLVAGQYSGSLSNDGEHIVLRDVDGNAVHDFTYSDLAPWPLTADGFGPSIEALTSTLALYGNGTNWRASQETGGSPGYLGFATDMDADGTPDAVELAFGSDPNSATSIPPSPAAVRNAGTGEVAIAWASLNGKPYLVEYRNDLIAGSWQTLSTVTATSAASSYIDTTANAAQQRFYRIKAQFP